jgi:Na+-driven multidrug efflux pump
MKNKVLALAAAAEAATGVLVFALPQAAVRLLFAADVTEAGVLMSRVAGISLIGLGVACWPGNDTQWSFYGMLIYSTLVMLYLAYTGVRGEFAGALLWPAVVAHAIIGILLVGARFKEGKTAA